MEDETKKAPSPSEACIHGEWALCPENWCKLFRKDETGIYVWCKKCKSEHKITFESLRAD